MLLKSSQDIFTAGNVKISRLLFLLRVGIWGWIGIMERIISCNLEDNLIDNIADFVDKNFVKPGKSLDKLCFVFGGKRPELFLKRELARRINKGFVSPVFFSIDEFMEYILRKSEDFTMISDLDAAFIIYELVGDMAPEILKERKSFSLFLPWAREILSFIEQLDLENIDSLVLKNIQDNAGIGYDVPDSINFLLQKIIIIRKCYHEKLSQKRKFSRGFIYLRANTRIQAADFAEFEQVIFCGLFYLHKTEKAVIENIYQRQLGTIFFQGSPSDWSVLASTAANDNFVIQPKGKGESSYKLSVQAGFDVHSEVCLVREIIKSIKNHDSTVIVLPDPTHIVPLLSEISCYIKDFNVSMGYPLKRSSMHSLLGYIFQAQKTRKLNQYYAKDYLKVLSHPLIKNLKVFKNPSVIRVLIHKIEESITGIEKTVFGGSLFVSLGDIQNSGELCDLAMLTMKNMDMEVESAELKDALERLHKMLFCIWENSGNFHDFAVNLEVFMDFLSEKSLLESYPLNLKMVDNIYGIQKELFNAEFNKEPFEPNDIFKVFMNKLDKEIISFSGSPLRGLQILGLFETRCLSFDNVIVMDVNESVLPSLKIIEPLIPRLVMVSLGLNRFEKEEEIQRYQFTRLLNGAKNVFLLYQDRADKEKSRFIEDIIWQRQKKLQDIDIMPVPRANFNIKFIPRKAEIKKDPKVIEFLRKCEYSASSLNTYLGCPRKFYYQYVLKIREKEDLLDEADYMDIGTFIHGLLEETFSSFIGKKPVIDKQFREKFFTVLDEKFKDEFEKKTKSDSFLIKSILDVRLKRFLDNEQLRQVEKIICLEETFKGSMDLSAGVFKFKAVIDRIDLLTDKTLLIIDYKTGSVDIMPSVDLDKLESLDLDRGSMKNTIKSFQLPLYVYLAEGSLKLGGQNLNAALYSLRDIKLNLFLKKVEQAQKIGALLGFYIKAMDALICEIINPDINFEADDSDIYQCRNCQFVSLCR